MLNWIVRYAIVADLLDREGWTGRSILDVGSGPHGLSCVRPDIHFVGLDVAFPERAVASMTALQAPGGPLPFADGAFDTVISLDTLEHMHAAQRPEFVRELVRVSARRVVIACPERSAANADDIVANLLLDEGQPEPPWLAEHRAFGLPSEEEVAAMCRSMPDCAVSPLATPNALLSLLAVFGDVHPDLAAMAVDEVAQRTRAWEKLFLAGRFGPAARTGWLIERNEPKDALVDGTDIHGSLPPAVRCLDCGGAQAAEDGGTWECRGCSRVTPQDPASRAWVLGSIANSSSAPSASPPPAPQPEHAARVAELETQLARVTAERDHARNLRIVRWTAPLRRGLYRLRRRRS